MVCLSHRSSFRNSSEKLLTMFAKIFRPHIFFLLLALMMVCIGLMTNNNNLDLAMFGAIIKVKSLVLCLVSAFFFLLIFVNYLSIYIVGKKPKRLLSALHIIFQVIALVPFIYFLFKAKYFTNYTDISNMNTVLLIAFILFLLASLIHIINFTVSLFLKQD